VTGYRLLLLAAFAEANYSQGNFAKAASLYERSVVHYGEIEHFRDQGAEMCKIGMCLGNLQDSGGAASWYGKDYTRNAKP